MPATDSFFKMLASGIKDIMNDMEEKREIKLRIAKDVLLHQDSGNDLNAITVSGDLGDKIRLLILRADGMIVVDKSLPADTIRII